MRINTYVIGEPYFLATGRLNHFIFGSTYNHLCPSTWYHYYLLLFDTKYQIVRSVTLPTYEFYHSLLIFTNWIVVFIKFTKISKSHRTIWCKKNKYLFRRNLIFCLFHYFSHFHVYLYVMTMHSAHIFGPRITILLIDVDHTKIYTSILSPFNDRWFAEYFIFGSHRLTLHYAWVVSFFLGDCKLYLLYWFTVYVYVPQWFQNDMWKWFFVHMKIEILQSILHTCIVAIFSSWSKKIQNKISSNLNCNDSHL